MPKIAKHFVGDVPLADAALFLGEARARQLAQQHCKACAHCAAVVTSLRDTVGLCRQSASIPLPDTVRERARESVRRLLDDDPTVRPRESRPVDDA